MICVKDKQKKLKNFFSLYLPGLEFGFGLMFSGVGALLGGKGPSPGKGGPGGPPGGYPSPSPGLILEPNPDVGGSKGGKLIGKGCSIEEGGPESKMLSLK